MSNVMEYGHMDNKHGRGQKKLKKRVTYYLKDPMQKGKKALGIFYIKELP